ncbi:MAG TPA: DUF1501 domain-containing protein [Caulifigura sp.]|nr:DUF1501 domain-containing protein [Caulifigura sp.]
MLTIFDRSPRICDGLSRRAILKAGGISALGLSAARASAPVESPRAKACIVLFLVGGPPQHSTWDPKPAAPKEIRGEFGPIDTNVPGIQICELLSKTARHADKLALLRAVVTGDNAHSSSGYYMLTGVPHIPKQVENANPGAPNDHPAIGAVVQSLTRDRRLLPPAIRLPLRIANTDGSVWPGQDSGWLGHSADPWLFQCEPGSANFDVPQFRLGADVTLDRLSRRERLLDQVDQQLREVERSGASASFTADQSQVFELLGSPKSRAACDLTLEPEATRDRYGRGQFGQSVLLARRLVEAGVKFVHVNWFRGADEPSSNPVWDSHNDETNRLKNVLCPPLDQALSALLADLEDRGLLDDTIVAVLSEFGRSPKINHAAGRDHWGSVFSVAFAGGGIRGGRVIGASDAVGGLPREGLVTPEDITATLFHQLGYEPDTEIHDLAGRPLPISRGRVIPGLV